MILRKFLAAGAAIGTLIIVGPEYILPLFVGKSALGASLKQIPPALRSRVQLWTAPSVVIRHLLILFWTQAIKALGSFFITQSLLSWRLCVFVRVLSGEAVLFGAPRPLHRATAALPGLFFKVWDVLVACALVESPLVAMSVVKGEFSLASTFTNTHFSKAAWAKRIFAAFIFFPAYPGARPFASRAFEGWYSSIHGNVIIPGLLAVSSGES